MINDMKLKLLVYSNNEPTNDKFRYDDGIIAIFDDGITLTQFTKVESISFETKIKEGEQFPVASGIEFETIYTNSHYRPYTLLNIKTVANGVKTKGLSIEDAIKFINNSLKIAESIYVMTSVRPGSSTTTVGMTIER